jgi:hypothetical protein
VGRNLQDHLDICTLVNSHHHHYDKLNDLGRRAALPGDPRRPGSSNIAEAGGFMCRHAVNDRPSRCISCRHYLMTGRNRLLVMASPSTCALGPKAAAKFTAVCRPGTGARLQLRYLSTETIVG